MKPIPTAALVILAGVLALQAATTPLTPYDEPLWYQRSQQPIWQTDGPNDYFWAVDVPGQCRLVYWCALKAFSLGGQGFKLPDYTLPLSENKGKGAGAPADAVLAMRGANVAASLGAIAALYLAAAWTLGSRKWALLAVMPVLLSPVYAPSIVPRVGPDALLLAWCAAFLCAWVWFHKQGRGLSWRSALVLGVIGGLATFAKINGALVCFAYLGYACCRRKPLQGLVCLGVAFAVYYLANPAFIGTNPAELLQDVIARRATVMAARDGTNGPLGFFPTLSASIDCWPLLPFVALLFWRVRKEPWAAPYLWWGGTLIVATIATINLPLPRYLGPVHFGLYVPAGVALTHVLTSGHVRVRGE